MPIRYLLLLLPLFLLIPFNTTADANTLLLSDQNVIIYPSHAHLNGDEWVFPVRAYMFDTRRSIERIVTRIASSRYSLSDDERANFRNRMRHVVADSDSRERPVFVFDNDPEQIEYRIEDEDGRNPRSDLNGLIKGYIRVPADKAENLLEKQNSERRWLTFRTVSRGHSGTGRVQLIEPEGLSVVSDIDDTIKITEIPAGARIVVQNTFFKDFTAAPGMLELYRQWDDATFHYVSGAPWQLFKPLNNFLIQQTGFPEGTFHMKNVRKNLLNVASWRDLRELATNEMVTFDQKVEQISYLMETYPGREFILVGDSGELDPEVYATIRENYPDQIREIYIRDVINARENNPGRLQGMRIIRARTIEPGVTQFSR